jgi:hypothetical protein
MQPVCARVGALLLTDHARPWVIVSAWHQSRMSLRLMPISGTTGKSFSCGAAIIFPFRLRLLSRDSIQLLRMLELRSFFWFFFCLYYVRNETICDLLNPQRTVRHRT